MAEILTFMRMSEMTQLTSQILMGYKKDLGLQVVVIFGLGLKVHHVTLNKMDV